MPLRITLNRRCVLLLCCMPPLFACGVPAPLSAQAAPRKTALTISSIGLERGCFGCAGAGVVRLRRDGLSSVTQTGNARFGTQDVTRQGVLQATEFDALARLLDANGFFAMAESYEDPTLRDGTWSTVTAVRDGQEKRVFSREDAAPAALRAIEQAIDAAAARIP